MEIYLDEFCINSPSIRDIRVLTIAGLGGLPAIRMTSGDNGGQDGSWIVNPQFYSGRAINFTGEVATRTAEQAANLRQQLSRVLQRQRIKLRVITFTGREFTVDANVSDGDMGIQTTPTLFGFNIILRTEKSTFSESSEGELLALVRKERPGGFMVPFSVPFLIEGGSSGVNVLNDGTTLLYPLVEINTKATNPELVNRTTGRSIKILATIDDGDSLIIDMENQTVTINGANYYSLIAEGTGFFGLAPGVNIMSLITDVPSESTVAMLRYMPQFISIG